MTMYYCRCGTCGRLHGGHGDPRAIRDDALHCCARPPVDVPAGAVAACAACGGEGWVDGGLDACAACGGVGAVLKDPTWPRS